MIKVIFELSEEMIAQKASAENLIANETGGGEKPIGAFLDALSCKMLELHIEEGKKTFVVNPAYLGEKVLDIFNSSLGRLCILASEGRMSEEE